MLAMALAVFVLFIAVYIVYDWWIRRRYVDALHKKAVFITGCDSGFGNVLAKSLYQRGVPVFAGCLMKSSATKLQDETGQSLKTVIIDVTDLASITRALEYVKENMPKDAMFWGLVNNAGILDYTLPMEFLDKKDYMTLLDVNLFGMIEVTKAFLPLLKRSKGRIVNMISINADLSIIGFGAYTISKHAADGYTKTLRLEQAVWGITVSAVKPAFYRTNIITTKLVTERMPKKWNEASPEIRNEYGENCLNEATARLQQTISGTDHTDLSPVIAAYEHGLFSVKPRQVYYPGFQATFVRCLKAIGIDPVQAFKGHRPLFAAKSTALDK